MAVNATSGFLSGLGAKLIVYPLDLCRKRLQIQGFQESRRSFGKQFYCTGFRDCIAKIYAEESFKGFFKGLQPSLLKAAIVTGLYFSLYEQFCSFLLPKSN